MHLKFCTLTILASLFYINVPFAQVNTLPDSGFVGINTLSPGQPFDVHGDIEMGGGFADYDGTDEFIHFNSRSQDWYLAVRNLATPGLSDFHIGLTQQQDGIFHIEPSGNIGIGTISPTQKLTVAGTINSREIIVEENVGADYVFEDSYVLPTLAEIEAYIENNKHLPGIPSAQQMIEEGVKVGELQIQLLKKIEELTLHMIELKKETLILQQKLEKRESGN